MNNDSKNFIEEFSKRENELVNEASLKYGASFEHAHAILEYSNSFVTGIIKEEAWIFISFLASVTNNLSQSLLALIRKHDNSSHLILRQAIESSILACYSLFNPVQEEFITKNKDGEFEDVLNVRSKTYPWFDANYEDDSRKIKVLKKMINERHSHSNLSNSMKGVKFDGEKRQATVSYFDNSDDDFTKGSLVGFAFVTMQLIEIISRVIVEYPLVSIDRNLQKELEGFKSENKKLLSIYLP